MFPIRFLKNLDGYTKISFKSETTTSEISTGVENSSEQFETP